MSLINGCGEVQSEKEFYENAEKYWKSIPASVNGMLGGYERITNIDTRSSKLFINDFLEVSSSTFLKLEKEFSPFSVDFWLFSKANFIVLLLTSVFMLMFVVLFMMFNEVCLIFPTLNSSFVGHIEKYLYN